MTPTKAQLFSRQLQLKEITSVGQNKLLQAKVVVVGCGGLGGAAAVHLAASGVGHIHLVDFDTVAISNLHRQVFFTLDDVGALKAEVLKNVITKRAPFTTVKVSTKAVTKNTVFSVIETADVVVDATDSLPTKYLLNDACVLKNKPLVYGSLYKFDGYVATFNVLKDNMPTANLRDAFPEMATDVKNCEDIGTLNSIVGTIALLQVNEVLKLITSIGKPLINKLLVYNALENTQYKINLQSRVTDKHIIAIFKKTSYFDAACTALDTTLLITAHDLQKLIQNKQPLKLISVTPNLQAPFKINTTLPLSKIETLKVNLANTYVIVCKKGLTSYKATQTLKQKYPALNVLSLDGGITNYKTHI